ERFEPARYRWLAVPDVALRKTRLARLRLAAVADIWSDNGFGFAAEPFDDPLVRLLPIEEILPYEPRKLKKKFDRTPADLIKREFPIAQEEVMRRLGLRAGSDLRLACTKIGSDYWVIRLK
ncbi:MAG: SAM-dependent methyltransferase, partial [Alistipes senegalensis]|nr:SAM-dependent methyltransferase [Alistipes senegalensis]